MPRRLPVLLLVACGLFLASRDGSAERCGPTDCGPGTVCCNYGCGICVAPGQACILPFCYWGRPDWIDAEHLPGIDHHDRVTGQVAVARYRVKPAGASSAAAMGIASTLRLQKRLSTRWAARFGLAGSVVLDSGGTDDSGDTGDTGYRAGLGATFVLPAFTRWVGWALVVDGEHRDGPGFSGGLALVSVTDQRIASGAAGIAVTNTVSPVPVTGYLRYLHSAIRDRPATGAIDIGLGISTQLGDYLFWSGGKPVPFGLRLHYRFTGEITDGLFRAHELGGGVYYFPHRNGVRIGVDLDTALQRLDAGTDATLVTLLARVDWYWDANFRVQRSRS